MLRPAAQVAAHEPPEQRHLVTEDLDQLGSKLRRERRAPLLPGVQIDHRSLDRADPLLAHQALEPLDAGPQDGRRLAQEVAQPREPGPLVLVDPGKGAPLVGRETQELDGRVVDAARRGGEIVVQDQLHL